MNTGKKLPAILSRKNIIISALAIFLLVLPFMTNNNFIISTFVYCFIFAALGVAWNLIGGYGAQISWCHSAFVAIGSYTGFILYLNTGISPFAAVPVAMVISFVVSTVIGYGTFRLKGVFFSLATIAFAEIVRIVILYFKNLTGGAAGLYVRYIGNNFWSLSFQHDRPFYYIMFAIMALVLLFTSRFEKSKIGHYLGAIKGDEDAATSLGIKTINVKLIAFQISAMIASAVGVFYAFFLIYIDPYKICSMDFSVKIGIVAIIGGLGTLWGPVLGAFLLTPLIQIADSLPFMAKYGGASQMLYGLVLILIVIFKPQGLITLFQKTPDQKTKMETSALSGEETVKEAGTT